MQHLSLQQVRQMGQSLTSDCEPESGLKGWRCIGRYFRFHSLSFPASPAIAYLSISDELLAFRIPLFGQGEGAEAVSPQGSLQWLMHYCTVTKAGWYFMLHTAAFNYCQTLNPQNTAQLCKERESNDTWNMSNAYEKINKSRRGTTFYLLLCSNPKWLLEKEQKSM